MKKVLTLIALSCAITVTAQTYSLEQLKDSALQNNIAVRSARHGIEAAQQQRKESFTKYFPNISGTGLWFNANKGMAEITLNIRLSWALPLHRCFLPRHWLPLPILSVSQ